MSGKIVPLRRDDCRTPRSATRMLPYVGTLPEPFQGIRFEIDDSIRGLYFEYVGPREALIACGAISVELLDWRGNNCDEEGDRYLRQRRGHNVIVNRWKPLERASSLPGFEPWMQEAAEQAHRARHELSPANWRRRQRAELSHITHQLMSLVETRPGDGIERPNVGLDGECQILREDRDAWLNLVARVINELDETFGRLRIVPKLSVIECERGPERAP